MTWKTATADDKLALIREVNRLEPALRFNPDHAIVETLALPFYPSALLLRFDKGLPGMAPLWYMKLPAETVVLDGSVANIHYINAMAPISLTAENIAGYLKFRLYFGSRVWLDGAVIDPRDDSFRATARLIEKDGVYDALFDVSARGETRELKKERTAFQGRALPAAFDL